MSTIVMPDPHPGRCKNYRHVTHSDGTPESLRCLDYENVEHVCTFSEPRHVAVSVGSFTYTPDAPQRWVKP